MATCPFCSEPKTVAGETWQQWQCAACSRWNDKPGLVVTVAMDVEIIDAVAFYREARMRMLIDHYGGVPADRLVLRNALAGIAEALRHDDGTINPAACALALLVPSEPPPGCRITTSSSHN